MRNRREHPMAVLVHTFNGLIAEHAELAFPTEPDHPISERCRSDRAGVAAYATNLLREVLTWKRAEINASLSFVCDPDRPGTVNRSRAPAQVSERGLYRATSKTNRSALVYVVKSKTEMLAVNLSKPSGFESLSMWTRFRGPLPLSVIR